MRQKVNESIIPEGLKKVHEKLEADVRREGLDKFFGKVKIKARRVYATLHTIPLFQVSIRSYMIDTRTWMSSWQFEITPDAHKEKWDIHISTLFEMDDRFKAAMKSGISV